MKRSIYEMDKYEAFLFIELATNHIAEDIKTVDQRHYRTGDFVIITLRPRNRQGVPICESESKILLLERGQIYFTSFDPIADINFDAEKALKFLQTQNFK